MAVSFKAHANFGACNRAPRFSSRVRTSLVQSSLYSPFAKKVTRTNTLHPHTRYYTRLFDLYSPFAKKVTRANTLHPHTRYYTRLFEIPVTEIPDRILPAPWERARDAPDG
jgi:hypothetical protein